MKTKKQPETAAALKRTLEALMDRGAIVRNLENLGDRALPYKISAHSQQHSRGGYFLVDFYAPATAVQSIMEHLSRDIDVIRPNVVKHPLTQEVKECEGIVPVPLEEKLYSTKKRKWEDLPHLSFVFNSLTFECHGLKIYKLDAYLSVMGASWFFQGISSSRTPLQCEVGGMACLEPLCHLRCRTLFLIYFR